MLLKLNSQDYAVTPRGIRRRKKDVFAPVFAQTGGQIQQAITAYDTRTFGPWIHGIGRSAIPVKSERDSIDYQMFQDSECDTRWVTGVYPGLLLVAVGLALLFFLWTKLAARPGASQARSFAGDRTTAISVSPARPGRPVGSRTPRTA
ncbi:hypothetical protein LCGC14_2189600 [marine sediment metagenome]|uniref:Uncharacterized protein n=1 Tax=marine sediment metagenome TaxID=412755 RepID=A0A0F9GFS7_9ZZZZ